MKFNKRVRYGIAGMLLMAAGLPARAEISTVDIVSQTMAADLNSCWNWQIVGICFWIKCTISGCSLKQSVQVSHYMPDLTVSVFRDTEKNSWTEQNVFNGLYQGMGKSLVNAHQSKVNVSLSSGTLRRGGDARQRALKFMEADVVGNPAIDVFSQSMGSTDYFCKSATTMMMPYFISRPNALEWRYKVSQLLDPIAYGKLIIGHTDWVGWPGGSGLSWEDLSPEQMLTKQFWGYTWPYSGLVSQEHEYKASAVVMHRAANLATRKDLPLGTFMRQSAYGQRSRGYWPAGEFKAGQKKTGLVQELLPNASNSCAVLPSAAEPPGIFKYPTSQEGHYAWNIWRPYTCCKPKGQIFLGATYNP